MNRVSDQNRFLAQGRGTLRSMQSSARIQAQPSVSGLTLVELDISTAAFQVVGVSAVWRKLLMQAEMAAPHLQVASIEGEHGSGKYTLAHHLFSRSPLASTSFQRRDAREWLATDANPATLAGFTYLDRVDLLAPPGQGLLLGVLKNLEDRPAGRAVLLASSQTPLRQMASQGLLLPDLAFRLNAVRFAIPPLRHRREDIAPLAQSLLDRLCVRYQQRPVLLGPGTLARLLQHGWPGNVRELLSVIENALLESDNGVIRPVDLALPDGPQPFFDLQTAAHSPLSPAMGPSAGFAASGLGAGLEAGFGAGFDPRAALLAADLSLDAIIHRHVQYVLDLNRGNKLRTARQLQISRSTLYRVLAHENFLSH
jgi:DNA-binding NtrC family response regulator